VLKVAWSFSPHLQHMLLFVATSPVQLVPRMLKSFATGERSLNPGRDLPETAEQGVIFHYLCFTQGL